MQLTYTNDPTAEEYAALRKSADWKPLSDSQLTASLKNSAFAIVARSDGMAVGLARVISDGGYNYFITDVIVLPEFQGTGIGRALMTAVMNYINGSFSAGETALISLMASKGKEKFYEKFGFSSRPNENFGAGLTQFIAK